MNAGIGAMGPYNHPNTAIGCAYSLLSRNGGGPKFLPPSAPPSILPRISNKPDAVYAPRMRRLHPLPTNMWREVVAFAQLKNETSHIRLSRPATGWLSGWPRQFPRWVE